MRVWMLWTSRILSCYKGMENFIYDYIWLRQILIVIGLEQVYLSLIFNLHGREIDRCIRNFVSKLHSPKSVWNLWALFQYHRCTRLHCGRSEEPAILQRCCYKRMRGSFVVCPWLDFCFILEREQRPICSSFTSSVEKECSSSLLKSV